MSVSIAVGDVRRIAHGPMRKLFVGQFLNALGNGLTLALLIIYLSRVRDIPLGVATALLAWQAVLALLISPISGTMVDRFGPRPILMGSVLLDRRGGLLLRLCRDDRPGVRCHDRGGGRRRWHLGTVLRPDRAPGRPGRPGHSLRLRVHAAQPWPRPRRTDQLDHRGPGRSEHIQAALHADIPGLRGPLHRRAVHGQRRWSAGGRGAGRRRVGNPRCCRTADGARSCATGRSCASPRPVS